ncbi:hypothetical protein [Methanolapillus ohkumae]|uniref:hypothetical protein n=1 Tax=Methanolapillus ohkumae TaxID=3028298 RepID=UPI0030B8DB46
MKKSASLSISGLFQKVMKYLKQGCDLLAMDIEILNLPEKLKMNFVLETLECDDRFLVVRADKIRRQYSK